MFPSLGCLVDNTKLETKAKTKFFFVGSRQILIPKTKFGNLLFIWNFFKIVTKIKLIVYFIHFANFLSISVDFSKQIKRQGQRKRLKIPS